MTQVQACKCQHGTKLEERLLHMWDNSPRHLRITNHTPMQPSQEHLPPNHHQRCTSQHHQDLVADVDEVAVAAEGADEDAEGE